VAILVAARPRQWTKNLLLFAGILFAAELGDPGRVLSACLAFLAYCAASSAAYLANDVRDRAADRTHPVKRRRPVAAGELRVRTAIAAAAALAVLALLLVWPLGAASVACLALFASLQAAYTLGLKRLVLVDVLAIAALFVVRAAAGALAVDVRISPWLLVCTGLLALLLALGKRRAELVLPGAGAASRAALSGYTVSLLDQLIGAIAAATIAAYAVYAITAHTPVLAATIPFVVYGVFRYLQLVHTRGAGEEPEQMLATDPALLVAVAVWAAVAAAVLAMT
jgi:4-hydroxybenzoate polyprenyltransferase